MRPVRRGNRPLNNINKYQDAKPVLIERLGEFCSYCERHFDAKNLHIEHILPKENYPIFEKSWVNFLLSCNSCNSSKGTERIKFSHIYLPDVDNTFYAFSYLSDGSITPSDRIISQQHQRAAFDTLIFFGLDNNSKRYEYLQRKRMEAWGQIQNCLEVYRSNPNNSKIKVLLLDFYKNTGFFSIWMTIFNNYPDIKNALIDISPSTRDSGCFDNQGNPISPSPNLDNLLNGGKI
ncbi:TPA: HNH endonuclease [Neisseria subflava]